MKNLVHILLLAAMGLANMAYAGISNLPPPPPPKPVEFEAPKAESSEHISEWLQSVHETKISTTESSSTSTI